MPKLNKKIIITAVVVIAIIAIAGVAFFWINGQSDQAIANKAMDYINNTVLTGKAPATLLNVSEESGLIKIKIKVDASEFDTYISKDGKLLFPDVLKLDQQSVQPSPTAVAQKQTCDTLAKTASPVLEAFIVSRCPYGLQMQRILADVVKNIPVLASEIKVRYIGAIDSGVITSMHGDAEAKENLRQICIREEQPAKYWPYVSCQMKAGDTAGCQTSSGVDTVKLNACVSDAKRGLAFAQQDFNLSTKYSATSSPTLILNGVEVSEFDFGGRTSDAVKTLLCCSSTSQPASCSTKLNTTDAATSFSTTYGASAGASGNSGATGTNCAPAQ